MSKTISVTSILEGMKGVREAYISYLYRDKSDRNQTVDLTTLTVDINLTSKRAVKLVYDLTTGVDLRSPTIIHRERQLKPQYRRNIMVVVDTGIANEPYDMTSILNHIKTYQGELEYILDWLACDQSTESSPKWRAIDFSRPLGQSHNSAGK